MSLLFAYIHLVIFMFLYSIYFLAIGNKWKNPANYYFKAFQRFKNLLIYVVVIPTVYFIIFENFFKYEILDNFVNPQCFFAFILYSAIFFYLIYKYLYKEIIVMKYESKNNRKHLYLAIILFIFCYSCFTSFLMIHLTNFSLDFSKSEAKVFTIKKSLRNFNMETNSEQLELHIEPPLYGRTMLNVDRDLQESANSGNQLRITIGKGLYNVKYIKEMFLLK